MPHIHDKPGQHDHTVTGYLVRTDGDQPRAMLHMHRKHNMLLPVGGHIELHETPWQAMTHELAEESGYDIDQLSVLQPKHSHIELDNVIRHPHPILYNTHDAGNDHYHSDVAFALVTNNDPAGKPNDGESLDIRWLTKDEILALPSSVIWSNARQTYIHILDTALKNWELVPTSKFSLQGTREFYKDYYEKYPEEV